MHVEQITTPNSIVVYNMWKIMKHKLNLAVIWKCNRVLVLRRTLFLPWLSSFTAYVVLILPQTNTLFYGVLVFFFFYHLIIHLHLIRYFFHSFGTFTCCRWSATNFDLHVHVCMMFAAVSVKFLYCINE